MELLSRKPSSPPKPSGTSHGGEQAVAAVVDTTVETPEASTRSKRGGLVSTVVLIVVRLVIDVAILLAMGLCDEIRIGTSSPTLLHDLIVQAFDPC